MDRTDEELFEERWDYFYAPHAWEEEHVKCFICNELIKDNDKCVSVDEVGSTKQGKPVHLECCLKERIKFIKKQFSIKDEECQEKVRKLKEMCRGRPNILSWVVEIFGKEKEPVDSLEGKSCKSKSDVFRVKTKDVYSSKQGSSKSKKGKKERDARGNTVSLAKELVSE